MADALASDVASYVPPSLKDNLAFSLEQAGQISGIGRSQLYLAVREGRLNARKCGRRTVVLRADLSDFLNRLPALAHEG
jgi:hypothetical protein